MANGGNGAVYQMKLELGHGQTQSGLKEKGPSVDRVNQKSNTDAGRSENLEELERRREDFISAAEWSLDFDKGAMDTPDEDLKKFRRVEMADVYQAGFNKMLGNIKTGLKGKKRSRSQIEDRLTARSAKSPHPFSVAEVLTGTTYKQDYLSQCTETATEHVRKMHSDGGLHEFGQVWNTLTIADRLGGYRVGENEEETELAADFAKAFPKSDPAIIATFLRTLLCSSIVIKPASSSERRTHAEDEAVNTQATTQSGWSVPVGTQLENEYGTRLIVPSKKTEFGPAVRALMDRWDGPAGVEEDEDWIDMTETPSQSTSATFPQFSQSQSQSFSQFPQSQSRSFSQFSNPLLSQDSSQTPFEQPPVPASQVVHQTVATPVQARGIESKNVASAVNRGSPQGFSPFSSSVLPSQASVPMDFRYGAEEEEEQAIQVASSAHIPQIHIVSSQPTHEFTQTLKSTKKKKKAKDRISGF